MENILGEQNDWLNVPQNLLFFVLPFPIVRVLLPPRVGRGLLPFVAAHGGGAHFLVHLIGRWAVGGGAAPQAARRRKRCGGETLEIVEAKAMQHNLPKNNRSGHSGLRMLVLLGPLLHTYT